MSRRNADLQRLLDELAVPAQERAAVAETLEAGMARYHARLWRDGGEAYRLSLREFLGNEYLLGFAAVQILRSRNLGVETRLAFVRHVLTAARPLEQDGIPYGMAPMLSFLAGTGTLEVVPFRSLLRIADIAGDLFNDWPADEAGVLLDWVIAKADIPDDERLWWLWYFFAHCYRPDVGKALLAQCLAHPALAAGAPGELARAWLAGTPAGRPPAQWRALKALLQGRQDELQAALSELDPDERAAYEPVLGKAAGQAASDGAPPGEPPVSFAFIHSMLSADNVSVPGYLRGQAVLVLAGLSPDPLAVCERYLDRGFYAEIVNAAIAEAVRRDRARMPVDGVRALIDQGLRLGQANLRKTFYALGIELFGGEYLERARRDNAKSIRLWAEQGADVREASPRGAR